MFDLFTILDFNVTPEEETNNCIYKVSQPIFFSVVNLYSCSDIASVGNTCLVESTILY